MVNQYQVLYDQRNRACWYGRVPRVLQGGWYPVQIFTCEAVGGVPEQAEIEGYAGALAHPLSLVKDDVKDQDDLRRGKASFLKRFDVDFALLLPDILIPEAQVCWQTSGLRATLDVVAA